MFLSTLLFNGTSCERDNETNWTAVFTMSQDNVRVLATRQSTDSELRLHYIIVLLSRIGKLPDNFVRKTFVVVCLNILAAQL